MPPNFRGHLRYHRCHCRHHPPPLRRHHSTEALALWGAFPHHHSNHQLSTATTLHLQSLLPLPSFGSFLPTLPPNPFFLLWHLSFLPLFVTPFLPPSLTPLLASPFFREIQVGHDFHRPLRRRHKLASPLPSSFNPSFLPSIHHSFHEPLSSFLFI